MSSNEASNKSRDSYYDTIINDLINDLHQEEAINLSCSDWKVNVTNITPYTLDKSKTV
ncbi:hypothetical protein H8S37_04740 [Mediterraneibacter sp. NSJ-55]|uniref:Uncharacterized protein n=1 Tax=Mediterraneibacter hominis TaxID=2763054 RepID=A0A923LHM9_9FIRM|nr:hypothetical protein [Mediterraneibacter hominis]MBC5688236.1 hypothetical protein [Mediterraneibacter hominis]